jgi:hypothetical protein
MADVFIGSEALSRGALTRGQLRWNYRSIFPDVYIDRSAVPRAEHYIVGAWLWSRRRGVIAGIAASVLHGASWFDRSAPVEMIWRCGRPPQGIVVRNEWIQADELLDVDGVLVSAPGRTGFDLARHLPRDSAVCHLDALARATGVRAPDVWPLLDRYPGARGVRQAIIALSLMDGGCRSARATQLRLTLIDRGLPAPTTPIRVSDGTSEAFIDMGYEDAMVGVVCGTRPSNLPEAMGWTIVRALDVHTPQLVAHWVKFEIRRRGLLLSSLRRRS